MTQDKLSAEKEIREGKIFAVISYWLFLCILPFLMKKDNRFAVFHGKQGLVLFIFLVAAFVCSNIPFIGYAAWRIGFFVYSAAALWGMVQALMGNYTRIPLISGIADKISI